MNLVAIIILAAISLLLISVFMLNYFMKRAKYALLTIFLFSISYSFSFSQELDDDLLLDSLIDDLFFEEEKFIDEMLESINKYNLLYTTVTFNSNTYFAGRNYDFDQFNFMPQITYFNSKGLNISAAGVCYSEYEPKWAYSMASLGYSNYFGKNDILSLGLGYSRYIYTDGWDTLTNSMDFSLGIRSKNRYVGSKLSGSFLFGNDQSFQLISKSYLNLPLIKRKKLSLKFRPQVNLMFAEKTVLVQEIFVADYFGLLNTQINIPLNLYTRTFDFEVGYNVNFPIPHETETDLGPSGFFRLSIGWLIDLSKSK